MKCNNKIQAWNGGEQGVLLAQRNAVNFTQGGRKGYVGG